MRAGPFAREFTQREARTLFAENPNGLALPGILLKPSCEVKLQFSIYCAGR